MKTKIEYEYELNREDIEKIIAKYINETYDVPSITSDNVRLYINLSNPKNLKIEAIVHTKVKNEDPIFD